MGTKRVYWKGLRLKLEDASDYIDDWNVQLPQHLTDEQWQCVQDTLAAILSCLALLPQPDDE